MTSWLNPLKKSLNPMSYFKKEETPTRKSYPVEGKYFFARSRDSKQVLTVKDGSVLAGSAVVMCPRRNATDGNKHQLWYIHPSTNTVRSALNGFCLDFDADGLAVVNSFVPGNMYQQWVIEKKLLRNYSSRKTVVEAPSGDDEFDPQDPHDPQVYANEESTDEDVCNQHWDFLHQIADSFYIKSYLNDKVLDVAGEDTEPGARVLTYSAWPDPRDNQLWYEDTHAIIRSTLNDFALDASKGTVRLEPYDAKKSHQQWVLGHDGRIHLVNNSQQVLSIKGGRKQDCAELVQEPFKKGLQYQLWKTESVPN